MTLPCSTSQSKADEAAEFLAGILLCHIPVNNWDFHQKVVYLAVMLRRMILAVNDPSQLDDKDYYGNKRLELAGHLLALLFEDLFKTYNGFLKNQGESQLKKAARAQQFDFIQVMNSTNITQGLVYAISSGNWNIKRFRVERSGVTQVWQAAVHATWHSGTARWHAAMRCGALRVHPTVPELLHCFDALLEQFCVKNVFRPFLVHLCTLLVHLLVHFWIENVLRPFWYIFVWRCLADLCHF